MCLCFCHSCSFKTKRQEVSKRGRNFYVEGGRALEQLPREAVGSPSLEPSQTHLEVFLCYQAGLDDLRRSLPALTTVRCGAPPPLRPAGALLAARTLTLVPLPSISVRCRSPTRASIRGVSLPSLCLPEERRRLPGTSLRGTLMAVAGAAVAVAGRWRRGAAGAALGAGERRGPSLAGLEEERRRGEGAERAAPRLRALRACV